jgi:hypothetical protein
LSFRVRVFDAPRNDGLNLVTLRSIASFRDKRSAAVKIFFSGFVDRIFTTLFEPLFTKLFDVTGANSAIACLYRACNAG